MKPNYLHVRMESQFDGFATDQKNKDVYLRKCKR